MLRTRPELPSFDATPLSTRACGLLWTAFTLDVVAVVTALQMGTWLDTASPLLSTMTLGGHHRIVLSLAATGLALLAVLAPLTHGFVRASRLQRVLLPVAGMLSLSALAGALVVVGIGVGAVLLAALLFRPQPRTWVDVRHRRR